MTQVGTAEAGQGGASHRDSGPGTWRAGIRRMIRIGSRPGPWQRGPVLAALALLLALFMLLHAEIPDWGWNLGSLVETFLPWFGLLIPLLLAGALRRRSASATARPRAAGRGMAAPLWRGAQRQVPSWGFPHRGQ